jgi:ABC-type nitrate/sulfonate/bicarbonate transport system substrate-binding protein
MKIRSARTRLVALAAVAASTAALASGCAASAGASSDGTTIRYQMSPGLVSPLELADALGYLHGVKLKNIGMVAGGPQAMQALATGQVDIAGSYVGAAANQIANGTPIKAVVAYYGSNEKSYSEIAVKAGSSVKTAKDLIGKKVAMNTLGAQAEALLDLWLHKSGLSDEEIKKVTLVPIAGIGGEEALLKGQVDAAFLSFAQVGPAHKNNKLRTLFRDIDVFGSFNGGSYEMTDAFLKAHPDVATKVVTAVGKAIEYSKAHTPQQVLDVYDKWLEAHGQKATVAADAGYQSIGVASKCGELSDADFTKWTDWLQMKGFIKGDLDASSLYTNQYNHCASGDTSTTSSTTAQ